jgi:5-methylcytosine-specific restriction endonuclease McrA
MSKYGTKAGRRTFVIRWHRTFGSVCHYCGEHMLCAGWAANDTQRLEWERSGRLATVDHVVPVSRGGCGHDRDNWQVVCAACNKTKNAMTHYEFLHFLDRHPAMADAAD